VAVLVWSICTQILRGEENPFLSFFLSYSYD